MYEMESGGWFGGYGQHWFLNGIDSGESIQPISCSSSLPPGIQTRPNRKQGFTTVRRCSSMSIP